jgi:hypothetical protein
MGTKGEIIQNYIKEILDYNPETGAITWRVDRNNSIKAGSPAGCIKKDRQLSLRVDGKDYAAKRVIWLYVHGVLPTTRVKSRDGDSLNLSLSNLELTTVKATLCTAPKPQLAQKDVRRLFYYADGKLFWAINKAKKIKIGDEARNISRAGYMRVGVDGVCYQLHQLVWIYFNGPIPDGLSVDHIDMDRTNNHIKNLRLVTSRQQQQNTSARQNNTSGFRGVSWHKHIKKWHSSICNNGKKINLGLFDTKEEAAAAYRRASRKLHENRRVA